MGINPLIGRLAQMSLGTGESVGVVSYSGPPLMFVLFIIVLNSVLNVKTLVRSRGAFNHQKAFVWTFV